MYQNQDCRISSSSSNTLTQQIAVGHLDDLLNKLAQIDGLIYERLSENQQLVNKMFGPTPTPESLNKGIDDSPSPNFLSQADFRVKSINEKLSALHDTQLILRTLI